MMMKHWIKRLFFGSLFAIPFGLASVAFVHADAPLQGTLQDDECQECHTGVYHAWLDSAHGNSVSDPAFLESWESKGQPRECLACHTTGYDPASDTFKAAGVNCEACHGVFPGNHPQAPMPSDRSANLCGSCHTETLFEWQVSKHRQANLSCVGCHGQHSTSLKTEDASELCASCHRDRASNFAHSAHSQQGMDCADCHLGPLNGEAGEGHAVRDHSFHVKLSTCNECHSYQMHDPVQVHPDQPGPEAEVAEVTSSYETFGVSTTPEPVSPLGFATLAGLVGLALGMVAAPWLERWFRRLSRDNR
jgi:hypothetical protein